MCIAPRPSNGGLVRRFWPVRGGAMQLSGYGLRRIYLPRTSMHKGMRKGRSMMLRPFLLRLPFLARGERPCLLLVARLLRFLVQRIAGQIFGTDRDHRLVLGPGCEAAVGVEYDLLSCRVVGERGPYF